MTPAKRIFYGWWIVFSATALSTLYAAVYLFGFSAFLNPIRADFGVSLGAVATAMAAGTILQGAVVSPASGLLVERFGPRRIILLGITLMGLGFVLLGTADSLVSYYVYVLAFVALGGSLATSVAASAAVASWFIRRRGLAFSFATSGFSLGAILVVGIAFLIETFGWRTAAFSIGGIIWSCGYPLALLIRRQPEDYGMKPDGGGTILGTVEEPEQEVNVTLQAAVRSRAFWLIFGSYGARMIAAGGMTLFFIPALEDKALSTTVAGSLFGLFGLLSLGPRFIAGYLGDRFPKNLVSAAFLSLMGVAAVIFLSSSSLLAMILFVALLAVSHGGSGSLMSSTVADYFGRHSYASIAGFGSVLHMTGMVIGMSVPGFIHDATGNFDLVYLSFTAVIGISVTMLLAAKRPVLHS